jgi:GLPGLI family protein
MRNALLLSVLLLANCSFAQFYGAKYINIEPANLVITYNCNYQQDSTNSSQIRSTKMLLFMGSSTSKFIGLAAYISDTILRKMTSYEQYSAYSNNPNSPKGGIQYKIYKNTPKGKMTFTDHIPSNAYKFEEDLDLFNWVITGDTSTVCDYKAQKAICNFGGRNWVAWFTPEIPYNDGPYKFNGLPGLIVKVYDTRNHYVFELLTINKVNPGIMIDMEQAEYLVTTKKDFFRAQDSFREDIMSRAKEAGMDNSTQQIIAKNMAQRNNPIELKRK